VERTWRNALLSRFDSSDQGLTSDEAQRRTAATGFNEPSPVHRHAAAVQLWLLFVNPLVLILLAASFASALLHDMVSAVIIMIIVLLSIALNFIQSYRSQRAAERLREQVAPTATVLRDGCWRELPRRELVPGDVIRLSAGDLVPADARLLEARDLYLQQAALTGESLPVEKEAEPVDPDAKLGLQDRNAAFLGTSVISGTATALIVATGRATVFGNITSQLADRPPETEFDRGTRQFSFFIMETVLLLVFVTFLSSAVLRRDPLQSLLFSVALAVGLTPEFLPMIVTVTLARGAVRMARKKVIVKHLAAMQNFGSMDILCSDKTGTLTVGEMSLDRCTNPAGQPSQRTLLFAYLNSANETGIKSPLDAAILQHESLDIRNYRKIDEVPFDFERRRLSVVVEKDGQRLLVTKGAPESVLAVCDSQEADGQELPLDAQSRERCMATYRDLSAQGYRLLAVAYRKVPEQAVYRAADETSLVLVGYAVFVDPPRQDARAVLQAMQHDGVQVKILTGDNELVTRHVCEQVGLDSPRLVLGDELDRITDQALGRVAEETTIFARLSPQQKNRVLRALKSRGHVVGYLGDGVNDAPSLHAADVGVSVNTAVDVARDAADIILMERSLQVLHAGILEGRQAFGNVMKYLLMGTSSNFGNMFSMAAASMFLPFLPMLPMQILLNNFLYDLAQITIPTDNVDASFLQKPRRWDIRLIRDFMLFIGPISSLFDFLTFAVLLRGFHADERLFHTGWFVESLATQTLVLFVIRTAGNPLRSRPSEPLTWTVLLIVAVGISLPYLPLAPALGFVPLPAPYLAFLAVTTATYLLLVELVKRRLLRQFAE
jgi:Mg2+-importing ATPase